MISFPKIALDENLKSGYLDFAKPADIVLELAWSLLGREHVRIYSTQYGRKGKTKESTRERWLWKSVKELETQQHDVLLLKVMLVLHIALVLQHLESGSQNEGGGVHNSGNQIKVALLGISCSLCGILLFVM